MSTGGKACIGCGVLHHVGLACVRCWPRLPWEIRKQFSYVSSRDSQITVDKLRAASAAALAWFEANPIERAP